MLGRRFELTHDRWHIRTSESVTFHASDADAQAGALVMGIGYVSVCLLPMAALRSEALCYVR
jgi:hypothetical protein